MILDLDRIPLFAPNRFDFHDFLMGTAKDGKLRYYDEFFRYTDRQLERYHDYIQYMFPTDRKSKYELAPTVSVQDARCWGQEEPIVRNMRKAYKRMKQFYSDSERWITPNNHNYRRISRMLRSMRMFSLNNEADDFFSFVSDIYEKNESIIGSKTYEYWIKNNENNEGK